MIIFTNTRCKSFSRLCTDCTRNRDFIFVSFDSFISRERLIGSGSSAPFNGFQIIDGVSTTGSVAKIIALENTLNKNKVLSPNLIMMNIILVENKFKLE